MESRLCAYELSVQGLSICFQIRKRSRLDAKARIQFERSRRPTILGLLDQQSNKDHLLGNFRSQWMLCDVKQLHCNLSLDKTFGTARQLSRSRRHSQVIPLLL